MFLRLNALSGKLFIRKFWIGIWFPRFIVQWHNLVWHNKCLVRRDV